MFCEELELAASVGDQVEMTAACSYMPKESERKDAHALEKARRRQEDPTVEAIDFNYSTFPQYKL